MSLIENRTWKIYCKRGFVEQCLNEVTVEANEEIRSTAAAEKELRNQGWTLHEDGEGTCPVCLKLWDGELELERLGSVKLTKNDVREEPSPLTKEAAKAEAAVERPEVEKL